MHLNGKEREYYENDLKRMLSDKASLQTAELKGMKKGVKQGHIDVARRLLSKGLSIEDVADMTELSVEEVGNLQR